MVTAIGAQAIPATDVPFQAQIAWSFNDATRAFGYDITVSGNAQDVAGAYLHRRLGVGPRGGIAHVLSKTGGARVVGRKTLTSPEADALKAGSLYISLVSAETTLSAHAPISSSQPEHICLRLSARPGLRPVQTMLSASGRAPVRSRGPGWGVQVGAERAADRP